VTIFVTQEWPLKIKLTQIRSLFIEGFASNLRKTDSLKRLQDEWFDWSM